MTVLADHPGGTIGDLAKKLNLDPDQVAISLAHLVGAAEVTKAGHGYSIEQPSGSG